jgi:hypothetical protein
MDLILTRKQSRVDGIFGELTDTSGKLIAVTLEHAYIDVNKWSFHPKLYAGQFTCELGPHRLHRMTHDFDTFEIMGVKGHDNILFHWGNFNEDSDGCVLLGEAVSNAHGFQVVTNSRATFAKFMALQTGVSTFNLTVK